MEHGRKWWLRVLLLVAVAVILIVGLAVVCIIMGPEAAESPVLLGILAVIVILATGARWYIMKDQP
jgi:hypothetical protein